MWDNQAITSVSVAAIKELIARVEFLEQRVQDLENGV
jgi:polyhydroxyalkanoate synthesis regulator phasin